MYGRERTLDTPVGDALWVPYVKPRDPEQSRPLIKCRLPLCLGLPDAPFYVAVPCKLSRDVWPKVL